MQYVMTVPDVCRFRFKHLGFKRFFGVFFSKDVRKLGTPLILGIIGVGAVQINSALDTLFARWADGEGPAFLWYAIRIQQLPLSLFALAISAALMPPLARAFQDKDDVSFSNYLDLAVRKMIAIMVPCTLGMFVLGFSGVTLLFGRGQFNAFSAQETTTCLAAYALGLLPIALVSIYSSAHYSKNDFSSPARVSILTVILNICLNSLFIFYFKMGAESVALATSFGAMFNISLLAFAFPKAFPLAYFFKVLAASTFVCLAMIFTWGVSEIFVFHSLFQAQLRHFLELFFTYLIGILCVDKLAGLGILRSLFRT